jgi:nucleoside-diphosphate-sugar epimerase
MIFSSTCATYGHPQEIPITEKHLQNPINPYGNSKLMVEQILLRDFGEFTWPKISHLFAISTPPVQIPKPKLGMARPRNASHTIGAWMWPQKKKEAVQIFELII